MFLRKSTKPSAPSFPFLTMVTAVPISLHGRCVFIPCETF